MDELMRAFRTLSIMAIGFAVLFGFITPSEAFKKIARMFAVAIALLFAWSFVVQSWVILSLLARVTIIAGGIPVSILALFVGTRFGREVSASIVGNWVYDELRNGCGCAIRVFVFLLLLALIFALLVASSI